MRVFISDLDGCLANSEYQIAGRIEKHFDVSRNWMHYRSGETWSDKYPDIDPDEMKAFLYSDKCWNDPLLWSEATPILKNIEEMQKWVLLGWVPSIVTARSPEMLLTTEVWLSKHNVPYSNLVFGAGGKKGDMAYHLGASFVCEDTPKEAEDVARRAIRTYVYNTKYNEKWRETFQEQDPEIAQHVTFVDDYSEITEVEKKLASVY